MELEKHVPLFEEFINELNATTYMSAADKMRDRGMDARAETLDQHAVEGLLGYEFCGTTIENVERVDGGFKVTVHDPYLKVIPNMAMSESSDPEGMPGGAQFTQQAQEEQPKELFVMQNSFEYSWRGDKTNLYSVPTRKDAGMLARIIGTLNPDSNFHAGDIVIEEYRK